MQWLQCQTFIQETLHLIPFAAFSNLGQVCLPHIALVHSAVRMST